MPASSSALARIRPAGPTNGLPCRSSWSPGWSPSSTSRGRLSPPPPRPPPPFPLPVLLVAWLLTEQHQPGPLEPVAHHRLGRVAVELAAPALLDGRPQLRQGAVVGHPLLGAGSFLGHVRRVPRPG